MVTIICMDPRTAVDLDHTTGIIISCIIRLVASHYKYKASSLEIQYHSLLDHGLTMVSQ